MKTIAKYAALSLPGSNACNKLKPDDTGYYRCILGGFNMENAQGDYYPMLPTVRRLFEVGGIVRRRLDKGLLKGEYGHPDISIYDNKEDILRRLAKIEEKNVSHHIKSIELQDSKDDNGRPIILAVGMVKPTGPYGNVLNNQMSNREENVAFSIRSFTNSTFVGGRVNKVVVDALTYDYVTEGGISKANKFDTVSLEEIGIGINFTEDDLDAVINKSTIGVGLENDFSTLCHVRDNLGWTKIQVVNASAIQW